MARASASSSDARPGTDTPPPSEAASTCALRALWRPQPARTTAAANAIKLVLRMPDRPRRPPPDYDYDRPRYRDPYDDGYRRRGGSVCVTARGNCRTRPGPLNAPCECEVPGFGIKRGQIGG